MMVRLRGPWAWSLGLHLVLAALVLGWWSGVPENRPPVVRMRLVAPQGGPPSEAPALGRWWKGPQVAPTTQGEPPAPGWRDPAPTPVEASSDPTVPFRLDELLAGLAPPADPTPKAAPEAPPSGGWSSEGQGYALPPLPPPRLAPPQGARWTLVLKVAGTGGYAAIEGLDSGHPELDQWLEVYLRTVVFPPSFDGLDYELRWSLRLDSERPE